MNDPCDIWKDINDNFNSRVLLCFVYYDAVAWILHGRCWLADYSPRGCETWKSVTQVRNFVTASLLFDPLLDCVCREVTDFHSNYRWAMESASNQTKRIFSGAWYTSLWPLATTCHTAGEDILHEFTDQSLGLTGAVAIECSHGSF